MDIASVPKECLRLLDIEKCQAEGFRFEFGRNDLAQLPHEIFEPEKNVHYFSDHLSEKGTLHV